MAEPSEIKNAVEQEFSATAPVVNLVEGVDHIFHKLGISKSFFRNPSAEDDSDEKVAGMTNTYLKPTRIGRKAVLGKADFFYGRKFNLMPVAYEILSYDAPADVFSFVESRIRDTLTDYMSIHKGNFRLNVDIKGGVITDFVKMGFDGQFSYIAKNTIMTIADLEKIILSLYSAS
jgi:hypothetical protein